MAEEHTKLVIPGASWEMIKRIIAAYHAVGDHENPSVEVVAEMAGKPRTLVSSCNLFLRSAGLLRSDENKLTELGNQLAVAIGMANETLTSETLQQVVREYPPLAHLIAILRARGSMKVEDFRVQIMLRSGMTKESRNAPFIKAILDLLTEGGLIAVDGDVVSLRRLPDFSRSEPSKGDVSSAEGEGRPPRVETEPDDVPTAPRGYIPTPFPLGPSRIAYLSLPRDWDPKELPRLLKMIELAFGRDD